MNKLLIPLCAIALLGAGCAGSGTINTTGSVSDRNALGETGDKAEARELSIQLGLKIVEAASAGVDATETRAWQEEAKRASAALDAENYAEASIEMRALIAEIDAAIAARRGQ